MKTANSKGHRTIDLVFLYIGGSLFSNLLCKNYLSKIARIVLLDITGWIRKHFKTLKLSLYSKSSIPISLVQNYFSRDAMTNYCAVMKQRDTPDTPPPLSSNFCPPNFWIIFEKWSFSCVRQLTSEPQGCSQP